MPKKYEFTGETKDWHAVTLRRIRRLADGVLGGWIEDERNLSHLKTAWVGGEAMVWQKALVYGDAQVSGTARVYGKAIVCDYAQIYDNALAFDRSHLFDNVQIFGHAQVHGDAWLRGNARVYDSAQVYQRAAVQDEATVCGSARIYGNAQASGYARVYDYAQVSGNARVNGNAQVYDVAQVSGDAYVSGDVLITQPMHVICVTGLPYVVTLLNNRTICTTHGITTFDQWRTASTDPFDCVDAAQFDTVRRGVLSLIELMDNRLNIKSPASRPATTPVSQRRRLS